MSTQSHLTWVTELDTAGIPIGYDITGDIIDHDGELFPVGEYSPHFDRAWESLTHYVHSFDNVTVSFITKTLEF